jgi:SAM-dependent methyltransferase
MAQSSWKTHIPWQLKILAKIVFSRLRVPYTVWSRLDLFKHGFMQDPSYAERVFLEHFGQVNPDRRQPGFTCLELGPGDSLLSAIVARKYGAERTYLVDVGAFADENVDAYRAAASLLLPAQGAACAPERWRSTADMLKCCHAEYFVDGVAALRRMPTGSVDFVWSQAVLEHVKRSELAEVLSETRRILVPGGVASHRVDLRDHLGGKLNNLRFTDARWEGRLFANSGFYTNRLRYSEIIGMAAEAGFVVRDARKDEWAELPTPRASMAPEFRRFSDEDLRVQGFFLTLYVP